MKSANENHDELSERLRAWRVDAKIPPGTADTVWRRIALSEARSISPFGRVVTRIQNLLSRPAIACAWVGALLLAGTIAGSAVGTFKTERYNHQLGKRYLASVNPYSDAPGALAPH